MAQEQEGKSKETETGCNNNEKNDSSLLWTISDKVKIGSDGTISCEDNSPWQQIGINQKIDTSQDCRTSWRVKVGPTPKNVGLNHIMIGIATKGIINQINFFSGQFMYGFQFYNLSGWWNANKHEGHAHARLLWAPGDEIKIEFKNYELELYINDEPCSTWKLQQYKQLKKQEFYPSISILKGTSCQFLGVTQH